MSFKEISENTGVSINTALGRMRYALINLRKIIEKNKIIFNLLTIKVNQFRFIFKLFNIILYEANLL